VVLKSIGIFFDLWIIELISKSSPILSFLNFTFPLPSIQSLLKNYYSINYKHSTMKNRYTYNLSLVLILISFLCFSCEKKDKVIERDIEEFEIEDHIIIGETMSAQIKNMPDAFKILDSIRYEDAYIYVNKLLSTLKLTAVVRHREDFNWQVTILHDDQKRTAFTLPGGHIYIYTGLLKFLQAEHELMAILGNEIAYADKELAAINIRETYGGVFIGQITLGDDIPELSEILLSYPQMIYLEEAVMIADAYAIELICPFQYDVAGLKAFLLRAQDRNIAWINSKKSMDFDSRLTSIDVASADCGERGVTNRNQYVKKIKNFLPAN